MSGPYCETCKHFYQPALSDREMGECCDSAKIIYDRNGNRIDDRPTVHIKYTCSNHATRQDNERR